MKKTVKKTVKKQAKTYSRRHIQEAIDYWTRLLRETEEGEGDGQSQAEDLAKMTAVLKQISPKVAQDAQELIQQMDEGKGKTFAMGGLVGAMLFAAGMSGCVGKLLDSMPDSAWGVVGDGAAKIMEICGGILEKADAKAPQQVRKTKIWTDTQQQLEDAKDMLDQMAP